MLNAAIVLILALAVVALVKGWDVRLVLFAAGLALASLARTPWVVLDAFRDAMGDGKAIGPICSAMGYAYVLKHIGADRDMVRFLIAPLRRVRWLLIPGGCAIGFAGNMAITSQTAVAAALGPILIPLMHAAGFHPYVAAATLVLGCSAGGNLFNPGEADVVAIVENTAEHGGRTDAVLQAMLVPELLGFAAATLTFWALSSLFHPVAPANPDDKAFHDETPIHPLKVLLPPLPIVILFLTQPRILSLVISSQRMPPGLLKLFELYPQGLPVTHAMVISTIIAMLVAHRETSAQTRAFFEGLGYGYVHVISLIIVAASFIRGMESVGLVNELVSLIQESGPLGKMAAGFFPWLLAVICGSGTGPSVSFSKAVLHKLSADNLAAAIDLGVLGAIGATFGRTMSPVAAIVIFTSALTGVPPIEIVRRTAPALAVGALVVLAVMLGR